MTKDKIHALELTVRLGYDAIEGLMELVDEPITDIMFKTATGDLENFKVKEGWFASVVRISVPPYPHGEPERDDAGLPIDLGDPAGSKSIFLTDAFVEKGNVKYAAGDGVIAKVVATAKSPESARKLALKRAEAIKVLDKQYRIDAGQRAARDLKKLREWGYLTK